MKDDAASPEAGRAREWLLAKDYEMFLSSHVGMSGTLLCDTLEAYAASVLAQARREERERCAKDGRQGRMG